ncbi:zinc-dependent alcohol dehydrogenase [Nonomuraea sediminis]|uniref:zinc-dependent alcohol dehydrogenase n=1 Tax=Nonomuraea sediminis TaxID=2835864 RepID=UPI001BDBDA42|nr:alcohol dehydrogenase catalytic domain-containing protein [Nonomuraea sediminis]
MMRALVFTGPGVVELDDVADPVVGSDEVLLHVAAAGICGSELHGVKTPGFRVPPLIMGHELAGTTDAGDPVVVNPILSCGRCDLCLRGLRQICRERQIIGVHRSGGFAERVSVPATAVRPLPSALDWERAAIVEPAANGVHAWSLSGRPEGGTVGIIGAGAIGLVCLAVALAKGAARVEVADRAASRLEAAARLGAHATGPALTGEYDVVFDAVGTPETHRQAVERLRPGGTTVWLGLANPEAGFDASGLVRTEKRIIGSFAYTDEEFEEAVGLVADWELHWVRSYPLDEGAKIFTNLMEGGDSPIRALLRPN